MSVHITARFRAAPGCSDALILLLRRLAENSRAEPGCVTYIYMQSGDLFTSVEEWADEDAARAHNDSIFLADILKDIVPLLTGRPEVLYWSRAA